MMNKKLFFKTLRCLFILCINIAFFNHSFGQLVLNQPNTTGTYTAPHTITLDVGFSSDNFNGSIVAPSILNCSPLNATPSANQNYIITYVPREPFTDPATLGAKNACEVMQSIQYFDGLGRPLQNVQVKGSPDATKDVIEPMAYDPFGREVTKYLPYTTSSGIPGSYRSDALNGSSGYSNSAQLQFYQLTGQNYRTINNPYSSSLYEASPLNRIIEQGEPGSDWQLGNHTMKVTYAGNNSTNYSAKLFSVNLNSAGMPSLVDKGSYSSGNLYVTVTQNENWKITQSDLRLNTMEEYTDFDKQVVLRRTYNLNTTTNSVEVLSTYYVYNDLGLLSFILPPKSEADLSTNSNPINQSVLDNLCYQYTYDGRGRPIAKKLPGKGIEYKVYNKIDQMVASQDSNQRAKNQWIIVKYDALGRMVMSGVFNNGNLPLTRDNLQTQVDAQSVLWEHRDNSENYGYTHSNTYPATMDTVLTVNYYDDYNIPNLPYDHHLEFSLMTRSLLTASLVNVLGTNNMLWTVDYYDDKGRIVNVYEQHYLGGNANLDTANYDHITNTYDFSNKITKTLRQHYTNNAGLPVLAITVADNWVFDHMGRKRQSTEQINNGDSVLVSQIDYNEIGKPLIKHLHNVNGTSGFLQDVSYEYNERGWLTDVSSPLFAMQLAYNTGTNAQYNGNISGQQWGVPASLNKNYNYSYDYLDRLTAGVSSLGYTEQGISYDKMGNIQTLSRLSPTNLTPSPYIYNYASNSNHLESVTGLTTGTYHYDGNGNVDYDARTGTSISYNNMNLPKSISGSHSINYVYDATGKKLRRVSASAGATDYISGIQYDQNQISFIQTEEGRAIPTGSSFNYEYSITDHLGNNRLTFDTKTGAARQVQANDYYPFGKEIAVGSVTSPKNEYLYNKKELQEETGLYDYGARYYDPEIGRFTTMDKFSEKYSYMSTYQYAANNPIKNIDMNGDSVWTTADRNKKGDITGYTTHITGRVLNEATKGISATDVAEGVNARLNSQSYTDPKTGLTYKIDAQFKAADNLSEVKSTDNLLVIVDKVTGGADKKLGGGQAGGIADVFGEVAYAGYNGATTKSTVDILFHEVGHNLGLPHAEIDDPNYTNDPMGYDPSAIGKSFTGKEMIDIYKNVREYGSWMNNKHYNKSIVVSGEPFYNGVTSNEKPFNGNWYPGVKIPLVIKNP